jgi:uncharacterized protein
MSMQLSRFVTVYEDVAEDEHVLYDVISTRYVGVSGDVLALVRGLDPNALSGEEAEVAAELQQQGFVVASREVDDKRLRDYLEQATKGIPGTMYVTLMPTLACNLACTYCFQNGSPAYNQMASETEAATIEFILRKVDLAATPKLIVHYFGGEPLTRKNYCLRTAEALSMSMAARGGSFAWEMTTNGVKLDLAFINAMNRFGHGQVKVTLDGDRETHDKARIYRSGKGTFDLIFENVVAVADAVQLNIGGNFLPGQEASYERLVQRLDEAGVLQKLHMVKFKPIHPTAANSQGSCTGCASTAKQEAQAMFRLDRFVRNKIGKSETLGAIATNPCELHWDNQFVIDPDGHVYKCPAVAGRPEVAIGTVKSETLIGAPLLELRPWEKCGDCAFLPVCVGGCLGGKYLETGRRDEVNCKKEWFEASFGQSVPRRYLEELSAVPWDGEETTAILPP